MTPFSLTRALGTLRPGYSPASAVEVDPTPALLAIEVEPPVDEPPVAIEVIGEQELRTHCNPQQSEFSVHPPQVHVPAAPSAVHAFW